MEKQVNDTLIEIIRNSNEPVTRIADRAGVNESVIRKWINNGVSPTLNSLQWVLKALGYSLKIVKDDEQK